MPKTVFLSVVFNFSFKIGYKYLKRWAIEFYSNSHVGNDVFNVFNFRGFGCIILFEIF